MRNYLYRIAVGIEGYTLEVHYIEAHNMEHARSLAINKYLHPDKGYNYISVKRAKMEGRE